VPVIDNGDSSAEEVNVPFYGMPRFGGSLRETFLAEQIRHILA
jgi:hypothetical protein